MKHVIVPEYWYANLKGGKFDIDTGSLPNNRPVVVLKRNIRFSGPSYLTTSNGLYVGSSIEEPYFDYAYDPNNKTDPLYVFRQQSNDIEEFYRTYLSSFSKDNPKLVLSELVEQVYFDDRLKELTLFHQKDSSRRSIPYEYVDKLIIPENGFSMYCRPVTLGFD